MPSHDDIVELTTAAPLRAQEIVHGLEALGIAARLHDVRGIEVQSTGLSRVYVFRRDLEDARAALPLIGRDVIAVPLDVCPACGHDIGGEPVERCPACGLAVPVPGVEDPTAHFGPTPGESPARSAATGTPWLVALAIAVVLLLLIAAMLF